ncbi:MAG: type II toxin-antitoxin system HicA family toxin [Thiobacillaceae bacterium]|nr:type II toxin-antitoxin system HicA family toxin [Thiobacillaceae bacterium]MCX7672437.1 type II toxin-antitoxin system HicA family toxin [Thiobacillaceae bacterium]MDW8324600.1 type II toxin-antitoxin system HicA family toxin [Burkholderiales bacterium]
MPPKAPVLSTPALIRLLERHGFVLDRSRGSHRVYLQPQTGRRVTVPFHRGDLPIGTLLAILKASGIPREDWGT